MVPVSLLIWLGLEIATYVWLGRHFFNADWPLIVASTAGGMLGIRAGINAITWVFASSFASPAAPLSLGSRLRVVLGEYFAFLFSFVVLVPFEHLLMRADRLSPGKQTPLVLVHGYGCSRGVWWLLRRRLEKAGFTVATLSLAPPYTSIGKLVPLLYQRIEAVCQATGSQQVTLIGHSMGGLVCRSYLARHGIARVNRLITLATPHQGSEMARYGIGQNAREMEPGSRWLTDLAGESVKIAAASLRNPYDNYVMPQDNQKLPGAQDIATPAVGHLAMLFDRRIAQQLIELLKTP